MQSPALVVTAAPLTLWATELRRGEHLSARHCSRLFPHHGPERVLSRPPPFYRRGRGSGERSQKGSGQRQSQRQKVGFRAPPCTRAGRAHLGTWATRLGSPRTPRSAHLGLTLLLAALPSRSSWKGRLRHSEKNGSEILFLSPLSANSPADFTGVFRQEAAEPGDRGPPRLWRQARGQRALPVAASPRGACLVLWDPEAPLHFPVRALAV